MTNAYATTFANTHNDQTVKSDKNKVLARVMTARLSNDKIVSLLTASSVDVRDMSLALYTTQKTVDTLSYVLNIDRKICDNVIAVLRTIALCYKHDEDVTKRDIEASILIDVDASDDRKHLVYKRHAAISAEAQVQYTLAAMRQLQILTETSRNVYKITANAAFLAACAALDIDLSDDEEIDALDSIEEIESVELSEVLDSENLSK